MSYDFNTNDYDFYVKQFIDKSIEIDKVIPYDSLRKEPYNLPDARWYVKHCPNKDVKSWADFVDWCGFVATRKMPSKEKVVDLIYKMQSKLNRPLVYDDFRGVGCYHISIDTIKKYWKNMNAMKQELGLEIVQESMIDKHLDINSFDKMIENICSFVNKDDRNFITTNEIDLNKNWLNSDSLNRLSKLYYNISLNDTLLKNGITLGKQGRGINFDFSDGEHVSSQFEYLFSKTLKSYGLKYNIDYFRDVNYKDFIIDYSKNMNCDYVIHINGKILYIEIAGVLEAYKTWYYENKPIESSKSKELYRQKLLKKENMLKQNNLHYYILFPCDLNENNIYNILNNDSIKLKYEIENYYQHNIDWKNIRIKNNWEI